MIKMANAVPSDTGSVLSKGPAIRTVYFNLPSRKEIHCSNMIRYK